MTTLLEHARSQSTLTLDIDEEELFAELGATLERTYRDPDEEWQLESAGLESARFDYFKSLGIKLFRRVSQQFHGLVCGGQESDEEDRGKLLASLKIGDKTETVAAVTLVLVGSLGLSGMVATLIATIVVKRLVEAAFDFTAEDLLQPLCASWERTLTT